MNKFCLIILFFSISYAEYLDIQFASFSYTIGGSYGDCVKFKKAEYNFNDFSECSCAWAANTSNYSDCYELYYNPQTKMIKYNISEGADYIYKNFSSDYTCHIYNEEIQINECVEMNELECSSNDCEWIVDIEYGDCSNYNNGTTCDANENCFWDLCYGGSYGSWSHCCRGGEYQVDNSYCHEIEVLECSEMYQLPCVNDDSCEWVEDIGYGTCSDFGISSSCNAATGCYWYCDSTYTWLCWCNGGNYEIDNSYCEEVSSIPGDANGDGSLNVSDIVIIVDLILSSEYDEYSDMNQDGILNIIDIIELVNRILDR